MTNQQQAALQSFKNELSQIHAAESRFLVLLSSGGVGSNGYSASEIKLRPF
jgi:hypothetical protein